MQVQTTLEPTGLLQHFKSDGVYIRVMAVKADTIIVGHKHKTAHLSILLKGEMEISINGSTRVFTAPYIFEALPDSRKVGKAITDVEIANIIPTKDGEDVAETLDRVIDYDTKGIEPLDLIQRSLICQ